MRTRKDTVLVVDDNRQFRDRSEKIMQERGYAVISAANGLEALKIVKEEAPNVILMDQIMPKMDDCMALGE